MSGYTPQYQIGQTVSCVYSTNIRDSEYYFDTGAIQDFCPIRNKYLIRTSYGHLPPVKWVRAEHISGLAEDVGDWSFGFRDKVININVNHPRYGLVGDTVDVDNSPLIYVKYEVVDHHQRVQILPAEGTMPCDIATIDSRLGKAILARRNGTPSEQKDPVDKAPPQEKVSVEPERPTELEQPTEPILQPYLFMTTSMVQSLKQHDKDPLVPEVLQKHCTILLATSYEHVTSIILARWPSRDIHGAVLMYPSGKVVELNLKIHWSEISG